VKHRRLILLGAFFLVAAILAYYLQDLVHAFLFVPVSYLLWGGNLLYQSIAQIIYWFLLLLGITLMAFGSLYGKGRSGQLAEKETRSRQGPLETVARQITRASKGVYYKWMVANRMGKLARSILYVRNGRVETSRGVLTGRDWDPPDEVAAYLVSGLTRTFADFPRRGWFSRLQETPFDIDLGQVLAYLESQMENQRD